MTSSKSSAPVLAIDGPGGAGKGTISRLVAERLGWHLLDSGALYRLTALAAGKQGVTLDDDAGLARVAATLDVVFVAEREATRILIEGEAATAVNRTEQAGDAASRGASRPAVRDALLGRRRALGKPPG